jgi:CheY-like chemotaxis protein
VSMTILIIDDSRFLQLAIDKSLRDAGYNTLVVSDGEEGLRTATQKLPDLILLDIMLPSRPGTSVLKNLKSNPITSGIPVILLSSLTGLDWERLKVEGAEEYVAKADLDLDGGCEALIGLIRKKLPKESATCSPCIGKES